jgi:hypothetical protein
MILALKVTLPPVLILASAADLKSLEFTRDKIGFRDFRSKAGTRIRRFAGAHNFPKSAKKVVGRYSADFGKWAPDQTIRVAGLSIEHRAAAM